MHHSAKIDSIYYFMHQYECVINFKYTGIGNNAQCKINACRTDTFFCNNDKFIRIFVDSAFRSRNWKCSVCYHANVPFFSVQNDNVCVLASHRFWTANWNSFETLIKF